MTAARCFPALGVRVNMGASFVGLGRGEGVFTHAQATLHTAWFSLYVHTCIMSNTKTYTTKYHIHKAKKHKSFLNLLYVSIQAFLKLILKCLTKYLFEII